MAEMTAQSINDLPDSDFAYIEPGGTKDSEGKTVPRSLRHFPIHDAAHVRNALARLDQSPFGDKARAKVEAAARKFGIGEPAGKADFDMKAESLSKRNIAKWLAGEIGRRVLVIPFGGPLPGGKAGLDLDGEYFDEATDLYGPYPVLRKSPWRVMDWHHNDAGVPMGLGGPGISMKGTVIGEIELDDEPDEFGRWAQWWIRAGQHNDAVVAAKRVAALQEMGASVYGSSQAVPGSTRKASDGHIDVWPIYRHTASTAPRNTYAVIPPMKAMLDDLSSADLTADALKALAVGLAEIVPDLRSLAGADDRLGPEPVVDAESAQKAGRVLSAANEALLRQAIDALAGVLAKLKTYSAAEAAESDEPSDG